MRELRNEDVLWQRGLVVERGKTSGVGGRCRNGVMGTGGERFSLSALRDLSADLLVLRHHNDVPTFVLDFSARTLSYSEH